ncbi:MAG: YybS family protein [Firmicutes bacterium]|nr:YybS family protein [Bacillota bacterium]
MDNRNRVPAMVEGALMSAIGVVMMLMGIYLPVFGLITMLIPLPFIILGVRRGLNHVMPSVIVASIISLMLTSISSGLTVLLLGGASALSISYMIRKKQSMSKTFLVGAITTIFSVILYISLLNMILGIDYFLLMDESLVESGKIVKGFVGNSELSSSIQDNVENLRLAFKLLLPFVFTMMGSVVAFVNIQISRLVLKRTGYEISAAKPLSQLVLPDNILMGTTIILILTYFVGQLNIVNMDTLFLNIFNIFVMVFLVQGLAVVSFFLEKYVFNKAVKGFVLAFILFSGISIFVALLGWLDALFDFRKIRMKRV